MITVVEGNILKAEVDAVVNPVNCRGIMGAGLARQVKLRWPRVVPHYVDACSDGVLMPGTVLFSPTGSQKPRYVVHFPTKLDWRHGSRLDWIEKGLVSLLDGLKSHRVDSVAVPALGCGLGGLSWSAVHPLIVGILSTTREIDVRLYAP